MALSAFKCWQRVNNNLDMFATQASFRSCARLETFIVAHALFHGAHVFSNMCVLPITCFGLDLGHPNLMSLVIVGSCQGFQPR